MIPRPMIIAKDRVHLDELVQIEIAAQGPAADLNHIDVSHIQVMNILFRNAPFVGNISKWDTRRVIDMSRMFEGCPFNGDISKWDTSNVVFMHEVFKNGQFCGDLSAWDTSRVTSMESMFRGPGNQPTGLEHWNVSQVDSFFRMFKNNTFVEDLSRWSPPDNAYAEAMFDRSALLNLEKPFFYHWLRVMSDAKNGMNMPDHLFVSPQSLDCLRPEWAEHFNAVLPLANGLGLSGMACARFIQEQWLAGGKPRPEHYVLPELDAG